VKRGLVPFTTMDQKDEGHDGWLTQ
jgi:hypothetical protein